MTSIRFVGDVSLWGGLVLSLIVCVLSWRYYRRESFDLPHRLRWLLPLLRSLAFFLGVMILTGPVLHHRRVIGELGRVDVYVDASRSMGLLDRHIGPGRKLLIAEQQGWLEEGRIDDRLLTLAKTLGDLRRTTLRDLQTENVSPGRINELHSDVVVALRSMLTQLTQTDSANATLIAEFTQQLIEPLEGSDPSTPPDEIVTRLTTICEAMRPFDERLRSDFDARVQTLIDTGDPSARAALTMFDETPRWRRAERALLETPASLFADLRQHHNVEVFALHDADAIELLDGRASIDTPTELAESPDAATTDLATGLIASQPGIVRKQWDGDEADAAALSAATNRAIVLLTDGQHNSGPSPLQTARVLGQQGIACYTVSFGATKAAPDLSVSGLEHPQMVFQKDRVRGTMVIRDLMPAGQSFTAQIAHDGDILWEEQLRTDGSGERRIEFEFGINELVERIGGLFDSDVKRHAVPLALQATVSTLEDDAEPENNARILRLAAITQNYRLLILDGRPRWETRYLRNVFERDSQWDVDVIIAGAGTEDETLPRGEGDDLFPASRDELFEYDLMIVGEVDAGLFKEGELTWMREFVETRGGGLVFIDGRRGRLREFTEQNLRPLLPIAWLPTAIATQPTKLQLTDAGTRQPALEFEVDSQANQRFWEQLPPPHTLSHVEALPGAEVLVEAVVDGAPLPAIVTRRYGAGRVLFLAFDETWRWRYKAADTYHQRIWNQLARYVMPRPFAVSDEYLSVDTGPISYQHGEAADIRIRLLGLDGKPSSEATVDALLWKEGRIVSTVSLAADAAVPGIYRGRTGELGEGEYDVSIRASGFSDSALRARGQFVVLPPQTGELQNTASDEALLQQMATESGGVALREEQLDELSGLLSPLSSGRVVESDTLLWQSYWWFAAIVILLSLEWFLRKRAGLL